MLTYEELMERISEKYDLIFGIDYDNNFVYEKNWDEMWFEIVQCADDGRYYFTFTSEDRFLIEVALEKFKAYLQHNHYDLSQEKITITNIYDLESLTSDMNLIRLYHKLEVLSKGLDSNSHIDSKVLSEVVNKEYQHEA